MSAWIVSKAHIDALVTGLVRSEIVAGPACPTPDELGQALWAENHASVNARYGEDTPVPPYTHEVLDLSRASLLKQVDCYVYQSCEHEGWEGSRAYHWTWELGRALELVVDNNGPEYDAAPWGIH